MRSTAFLFLAGLLVIARTHLCLAEETVGKGPSPSSTSGPVSAGTLSGSLLLPEGSPLRLPASLKATLLRPGSRHPGEPAVECPVVDRRWSCDFPVGTFDVRLEAPLLAPLFLRAITILPSASQNAGVFRLVAGSSFEGWVTNGNQGKRVVVEAVRVASGPLTGKLERGQSALTSWSVTADERGHFRLDGLPPGRYEIQAVSGTTRSVPVQYALDAPGTQRQLDAPLDLRTGTETRLTLEPPVDVWGEPWKIVILAPTSDPTVLRTAIEATASYDGSWSDASLVRGNYSLQILDSRSGAWHNEELRLHAEVEERFVALEVVPVRGEVSFPAELPSAARVRFSGEYGRIEMDVDDEGGFEGSLPAEQRYELDIITPSEILALDPVQIRRRPGKSHVELNLSLPNTSIAGVVTDKGKPVESSVLMLRGELDPRRSEEGPRVAATIRSGEDGRFRALGVLPGHFYVRASSGHLASPWTSVDLVEDGEIELELRLASRRRIAGRTTMSGQPLPGVKIFAQAPDDLPEATTSSLDGSFTLQVSEESRQLDLLLVPPIGGLTFRRLDLIPAGGSSIGAVDLRISQQTGHLVIIAPLQPTFVFRNGIGYSFDYLTSLLIGSRITAHSEAGLVLSEIETGTWWICGHYQLQADSCTETLVLPGVDTLVEPPIAGGLAASASSGGSR